MGTTFRFLSTIEEAHVVLDWFRTLPEKPEESLHEQDSSFYFRKCGPLNSDASKSPVVNVFVPRRKRGVLTTVGEVHFLLTPVSSLPAMNRVSKQFRKWLMQNRCVHSHRPDFVHKWDYFLEGSATNWDPDIFALPAGFEALQQGAYFVAADDNEVVLNRVCRALELRGVQGIEVRS
jgi:hypothetical protein